MKRFRYMLCILGLSGLFFAYQFDAMATCSGTTEAGRFCKLGSKHDCRRGCWCEKNTTGADVGSIVVDTWCNRTRTTDLGEDKVAILSNAKVYRCPSDFPESAPKSTNEKDCHFCKTTNQTVLCLPVYNEEHNLLPGKYIVAGTGSINTCTRAALGRHVYCPGGNFKPHRDNNRGVFPCDGDSEGSLDLKNCEITCGAGEYLAFVGENRVPKCEVCPDGYGCPGNKKWIVKGVGSVTTDQGKYACSGESSQNISKSACKIYCGPGSYLSKNGNTCLTCPRGYRCPGMTVSYNLTLNDNGQWGAAEEQGRFKCGSTEYQNQTGQTTCEPCPSGQQANLARTGCLGPVGAGGQEPQYACRYNQVYCQPTTYLPANSTQCSACLGGYMCPGGCYAMNYSQDLGITKCQAGTAAPAGSSTCESCGGVNEYSAAGALSCSTCETSYVVNEDHTGCDPVYTVSYSCGNGTGISGTAPSPHTNVKDNDHITIKYNIANNGCEKTNANFDHWEFDANHSFNEGDSVAWTYHTRTLVAAYTSTGCDVTYMCDNGTNAQTVKHYSTGPFAAEGATLCSAPADKEFDKWTVDNLSQTPVNAGATYSCNNANFKMIAQWKDSTPGNITCAPGSYLPVNSPNASYCRICPAGNRCPGGSNFIPNHGEDQGKSSCPAGTFSDGGAQSCTPCGNGRYAPEAGSLACEPCVNGIINSQHTTCTPCADGETVNSTYEECTSGATSVNPGSGGSDPTTITCYDGYYLASGANVTSCTKCTAGYKCVGDTFTLDGNEHGRTICPKGTYSHEMAYVCAPCGTGYYSDTQGASDCTYCNGIVDANNESCNPCNTDETVNGDHSACDPVTPPNSGQVQCQQGYYLPARSTLTSQCTICPRGSMCPSVGNYEKNYSDDQGRIGCVGNTYSDHTGALECTECSGTVSEDHKSCNTGTGGGNGGNTTVTTCPSGQYVPVGGTSCTNCPSGSFCPTAGTAVAGKSYSCFMGTPNSSRTTCRMVLDKDNLLYGLGNGDNCWLKPMTTGVDGYKHCMFEGIRQVQ